METKISYEIFFTTSHDLAYYGMILPLTPLKRLPDVDETTQQVFSEARVEHVDLKIITFFETEELAIEWYSEFQKKVRKFIEEYSRKHTGFCATKLIYTLPKHIYILKKITYENN